MSAPTKRLTPSQIVLRHVLNTLALPATDGNKVQRTMFEFHRLEGFDFGYIYNDQNGLPVSEQLAVDCKAIFDPAVAADDTWMAFDLNPIIKSRLRAFRESR